MIDRRLLADIGLALLIALPSTLPAAPGPWNAADDVGKADSPAVESPTDEADWAKSVAADRLERAG